MELDMLTAVSPVGLDGPPITVTVCCALTPFDVTVMTAVPPLTPVTTPVELTVATAVLDDVHVNVGFVMALLFASAAVAVRVNVWPMVSDGAVFVIFTDATAPSVPVAVNVTGVVMPVTVAVTVFVPGVGPSFQLPAVATPFASVVGEPPLTLPPPVATANVTVTLATGLPF